MNNTHAGFPNASIGIDNISFKNLPELFDCNLRCYIENYCSDRGGLDTFLFKNKSLMGEFRYQEYFGGTTARWKELDEKENPPLSGVYSITMPEFNSRTFGTSIEWTRKIENYSSNQVCNFLDSKTKDIITDWNIGLNEMLFGMLNEGDVYNGINPVVKVYDGKALFDTHTRGGVTYTNIWDTAVDGTPLAGTNNGIAGDNIVTLEDIEGAMRLHRKNAVDFLGRPVGCGCTSAKLYVNCATVVEWFRTVAGSVIVPTQTAVSVAGFNVDVVLSEYVLPNRGYLVTENHDMFFGYTKALESCYIDPCVTGGQIHKQEFYVDIMFGVSTDNGFTLIKF